MASLALFLRSSLPLGQVVRIQLPVQFPSILQDNHATAECCMPRPLPSHFGHLNALLQQLTSLASSELPFVSWIAGSDTIHVACAKVI